MTDSTQPGYPPVPPQPYQYQAYTPNPHGTPVPFVSMPYQVRRVRRWRLPVAIAVVLGTVALGAAVVANTYAARQMCSAVRELGKSSTALDRGADNGGSSGPELRKAAAQARTLARMLVFDGELRNAAGGIARDTDRLAAIQDTFDAASPEQRLAMVPEIAAVMGDFGMRVRDVQRACGQPQNGVPQ